MKSLCAKLFKLTCAFALAFAYMPIVAQPASAYSGLPDITVDGFTYYLTNATKTGSPATLWDVDADEYASSSVIEVPGEFTADFYDSTTKSIIDQTPADGTEETYDVTGIIDYAFKGCTSLQDVRIGDLGSTGKIYAGAFEGCDALEIVHMLGGGDFNYQMHTSNEVSLNEGISIVLHQGATWNASASSSNMNQTGGLQSGNFPNGMTSYYSVLFEDESDNQTEIFVKGPSLDDSGTYEEGTLPSALGTLSEDDVYCDATRYDDKPELMASPNSVSDIPELAEGDTWVFSATDGTVYAPDEEISACGTATMVQTSNLDYAVMGFANCTQTDVDDDDEYESVMYYNADELDPGAYVTCADGTVLSESNYTLSYYSGTSSSDGTSISASDIVDAGSYTVKAQGSGEYSGSCEATFVVSDMDSTWTRAAGTTRFATAQAIASKESSVASTFSTDDSELSVNKNYRVLVNPDDYSSCLLATSLAGVLNCSVLMTGSDELATPAKSALASLSDVYVLIVGSTDYIPESVQEKVDEYASEGSSRVTSSADAATAAVDIFNFEQSCENDDYDIDLAADYGSSALLVPEGESAALFSAAAWGYGAKAPTFVMGSDGSIGATTLSALETTDTSGAARFNDVIIAGADSSAVTQAESSLSEFTCTIWEPKDDEYESSAAYVQQAADSELISLEGLGVADASDYGYLSAGACAVGIAGCALLVSGSTTTEATAAISFMDEHAYDCLYGYVLGGYDNISQDLMERLARVRTQDENGNLYFSTISASATSFVYTGSAQVPTFTLTDSEGAQLTETDAYTVKYYSNATNTTLSTSKITDLGRYTIVCSGTLVSESDAFSTTLVSGTYYNTRSCAFEIVPAAVGDLAISAFGSDSVSLAWTSATGADGYVVYVKESSASDYEQADVIEDADTTTSTISDLAASTSYTFKVLAYANYTYAEDLYSAEATVEATTSSSKSSSTAKTSKKAKKTKITVNVKKVTAKTVKAAAKKAGTKVGTVKTITLGTKVRAIAKRAFAKCTKCKQLVLKTKKLARKRIKGCLKGSKVKTVKVSVGSKKTNKRFKKKYKKIFTKKICGKKVKVK